MKFLGIAAYSVLLSSAAVVRASGASLVDTTQEGGPLAHIDPSEAVDPASVTKNGGTTPSLRGALPEEPRKLYQDEENFSHGGKSDYCGYLRGELAKGYKDYVKDRCRNYYSVYTLDKVGYRCEATCRDAGWYPSSWSH